MSATIVLNARLDAVHMLVDGLAYGQDGRISAISQKAWSFPVAGFVITSMGIGHFGLLAGVALEQQFGTFDAILAGAEAFLPEWYERNAFVRANRDQDVVINTGSGGDAALFLAGWSRERGRAEAYTVTMWGDEGDDGWSAEASRQMSDNETFGATKFKLERLLDLAMNPAPEADDLGAAGMVPAGFASVQDWFASFDPELDLLHLMEIQRRIRRTAGGFFLVGGLALLTSVTEAGISQRVVHRWIEDEIGSLVEPLPILDWKAWRAERVRAAAPPGESPLKREMREAKERKQMRKAGVR
jgi:hypothetical protein